MLGKCRFVFFIFLIMCRSPVEAARCVIADVLYSMYISTTLDVYTGQLDYTGPPSPAREREREKAVAL